MAYLVFSQQAGRTIDLALLAAHASRFFGARLEHLETGPDWVRVRLFCERPRFDAELTVRVRAVTKRDLEDAKSAEARGRAAGMSTLAEKCAAIWEIVAAPHSVSVEAALVSMSGICASVALGPVLPPDHSTLFGVRGAMERLALLG